MSYCRFSADDYTSSVYVYYSDDGWVTHVAAANLTWLVDLPEPVSIVDDVHGYVQRSRVIHDLLDDPTTHRKVPLPEGIAGEMFIDDSPGECADRLSWLLEQGVTVPDGVIESLREEQAEGESC